MYVCICNAITEKQVRLAAEDGARDLWDLQRELGVAAGCGSCKESASAVLREVHGDLQAKPPTRYVPGQSITAASG